MTKSPLDDMAQFRSILQKAKNIVVISGAGISAESGVPTFRGAGGFWRKYESQKLATPEAFKRSPSLVWEFYHYRRELVLTKKPNLLVMTKSPLDDMAQFRSILQKAKNIVVISGAGISAESGVPTFRGAGGFWRKYESQKLATPEAFKRSPSLVWEFYHYRRELVLTKKPNLAHIAIAEFEKHLENEGLGRQLTVITQNVDGLHIDAGSKSVLEIHGSLFKTRCLKCNQISVNRDSPICEALRGRGAPDLEKDNPEIPEKDLPCCKKPDCNGLLRPHIVWFGESLHTDTFQKAEDALAKSDVCLVVGTSSVVYPAAMFAPALADRGVPVAEFNLESTPATSKFKFHFEGPCATTIPEALKI